MGILYKVILMSVILCRSRPPMGNCQLQAVPKATHEESLEFVDRSLSTRDILETGIAFLFNLMSLFPKEISDDCITDVKSALIKIVEPKMWSNIKENWAAQLFDSLAKPPSGIMNANIYWLGSYQQCIDVVAPYNSTKVKFIGEYCLVNIYPKTLPEELTKMTKGLEISIKMGLCFPSTCSLHDKSLLLNYTLKHMKKYVRAEIRKEYCQTKQQQPMDATTIVLMCTISTYGIFVLIATLVELKTNSKKGNSAEKLNRSGMKIFTSFSAIKSLRAIFKSSQKSSNIRIIQGIRVVSIAWVIAGHTILYCVMLYPWRNQAEILPVFDNFFMQPLLFAATYSVISFFVISGFLVSYLYIQRCEDRHEIPNIFGYYLFRYLRITPPLILMILFISGPYYYLNNGPIWAQIYESGVKPCRSMWWTSILYIQNFVRSEKACLPVGWYLSTDTQLYMLAPIILNLLYRKPFLGVLLMGVVFASTTMASIIQIVVNGQQTFLGKNASLENVKYYIDNFYRQPHNNAPSYIIGMTAGYILHLMQKHHFLLSKKTIISCWICALTIILVIVYGTFPYFNGSSEMSPWVNVMYGSLAKPAWALAISWIILACALGYGGIVNWLLTQPPFVILGRLTYCAYLVHTPILNYYYYGQKDGLYFSIYNMIMVILATFITTVIGAILLSALIEMPILNVLKQLGKKYDKVDRDSIKSRQTFKDESPEKTIAMYEPLIEVGSQVNYS